MKDVMELIERLRGFEIDHKPDGWPAIRMRDVSALCNAIDELTELSERLKNEAQIHAQEARTAKATIAEIYQAVTGATGEPGNWNGAKPVIDDFLEEFKAAGKERMAQSFRSFLVDLCNKAIAIGWATHNPADVTEEVSVKVRRSRLTLDTFMAIYDKAADLDPYLQRAMELALITAQRREDISLWERSDIRDSALWVEQGKSENIEARGDGMQTRLVIPLDLRLTIKTPAGRVIDWALKETIARCRADHVASRYLIHHSKKRTKSNPGDPVWRDTISKAFAKARDLAGLTEGEGKTPPTFHEIRSLSIRIWKELRGKDFAQALAGHKQASTTDVYANERGNWVVLKSA